MDDAELDRLYGRMIADGTDQPDTVAATADELEGQFRVEQGRPAGLPSWEDEGVTRRKKTSSNSLTLVTVCYVFPLELAELHYAMRSFIAYYESGGAGRN
jgi:hypothetical protein